MTITVSGGSGSFDARLDELVAESHALRSAGAVMRDLAGDTARASLNGSVVASGLLCPAELLAAEGAIATASASLLAGGVALEVGGALVEAAVTTYRAADEFGKELFDSLYAVGGMALGAGAVVGTLAYALTHPTELALLVSNRDALLAKVQESLFANPWLMEGLSRVAPGMIQGALFTGSSLLGGLLGGPMGALGLNVALLWGAGGHWPTTDYESAVAGLVALGQKFGYFNDTSDWPVSRVEIPPDARSPRGLEDIFNQQSSLGRDGSEGQIQIVQINDAEGHSRWVVQIPGTQDWDPTRTTNPVDLTSNVHLMTQEQQTALQRQVAKAMDAAGIKPGEPVMLTGHSQGGIAAATFAADPAFRERFNVTSVVTGGSPIARIPIPDSITVMSVEHTQDPVPMLDGRDNPARDNWITVKAEADPDAIRAATQQAPIPGDAHDTTRYAETGRLIDQSTDPAVVDFRTANSQFLDGTGTVTRWKING